LLSAFIARGEIRRFVVAFSLIWRLTLYMAAASAVGLALTGEPLIRLLFQRGKFEPADTLAVAKILAWSSSALAFGLAYPPVNAALLAFRQSRRLPIFHAIGLAAYLPLAWISTHRIGTGVPGLGAVNALSLNLVLLISAGYLAYAGLLPGKIFLQGLGRALVLVPMIGIPVALCRWGLEVWSVRLIPMVLILMLLGVLSSGIAVSIVDPEVQRRVLDAIRRRGGAPQNPVEVESLLG
jgi:putative peptidoglycan lipid II flippase